MEPIYVVDESMKSLVPEVVALSFLKAIKKATAKHPFPIQCNVFMQIWKNYVRVYGKYGMATYFIQKNNRRLRQFLESMNNSGVVNLGRDNGALVIKEINFKHKLMKIFIQKFKTKKSTEEDVINEHHAEEERTNTTINHNVAGNEDDTKNSLPTLDDESLVTQMKLKYVEYCKRMERELYQRQHTRKCPHNGGTKPTGN